jgi:HEAT repeat protein
MERRTRQRADVMAKARAGDAAAVKGLLDLLASDEIPAWKASASLVLDQWTGQSAVRDALTLQLQHEHPLVRTSAIRALEGAAADPGSSTRHALRPMLKDPSRGVRVSAAWALRDEVDLASPLAKTCCTC